MRTMERLPVACLCLLLSCSAVGSAGSRVVVVEDSDAILPCSLSTKEDITLNTFDWTKDPQKDVFLYVNGFYYDNGRTGQDEQFRGRVSNFPDELQHGDASIIIRKTKLADSGNYTCYFPRLQPPQTFHIELVVGSAGSRVDVFEDSDVILPCSLNTTEDIRSKMFDWTKDPQKDVFLYDDGLYYDKGRTGQDEQFRGRVSHFPDELQHGNASIIIRKTKLADRGKYTCQFPNLQPPQTSHIELVVGRRVVVVEDSDAILPCSLNTKEDIRSKLFDWKKDPQKEVFMYDAGLYYDKGRTGQDEQFRGRVSHFPDELQHGDASIIIRKTKVADRGKYTCDFPRLQPRQTFHIELVVGVSPKPSVTILDQKKDWSLLQCEVHGASPKPKVEWRDSSGNILPAEETLVSESGGSFYITIKTTVTKTDTYRCVSTQKEINHQIYTETSVYMHEFPYGLVVAVVVLIILLVVALVGLALLYAKLRRAQKSNSASQPPGRDEVALNGSSSKEATEP